MFAPFIAWSLVEKTECHLQPLRRETRTAVLSTANTGAPVDPAHAGMTRSKALPCLVGGGPFTWCSQSFSLFQLGIQRDCPYLFILTSLLEYNWFTTVC